jgi:hypothetical protein
MLIPKPLIIDKENKLHGHGGYPEVHDPKSIPLQDHPLEQKPLLDEGTAGRENAL